MCFQASHKPLEHISIQGNAGYMALGGADEVCVWKYNLPWTWAKTGWSADRFSVCQVCHRPIYIQIIRKVFGNSMSN